MRAFWPWLWGVLGAALIYRAGSRSRGVITDHLEFGRRVFTGHLDLYAPFLEDKPLHAPYPPSFGLLTAPFSLVHETMGETAARVLWAGLQVLALFWIGVCLRGMLRRLAPDLEHRLHLLLFATALVTLRYTLRDTHGGGSNLIILALILASVRLAIRNRPILGGTALGFSLATKPTGLLFLPLLFGLGFRKAAHISLYVALLCLGLALGLLGGFAPFLHWFDGTVTYAAMNDVFAEPEHGFPPFTWMNQCLRCAVGRYCGNVPPQLAEQVPGFFPGLGLAPAATAWIARLLGLTLLATTGWAVWRRRHDTAARPYHVALVLCLSLLLSPISWKAHHVALIPACFLVVLHGARGRRWAWIFLGAYILVCGLGEQLVGKELKNVQQSLYLTTAGTLAFWGILLRWSLAPPEAHARASLEQPA